jgi:hypothetical protein
MLNVVHKHKGGTMYFASVRSGTDHFIYLSAYGQLASGLLEKYVADQRADNEELFAEWDKSLEEADAQTGFSAAHEVEDGYVYISTFQDGVGAYPEETMG